MSFVDLRFGDFRAVLSTLETGSVDAIVTDPPYRQLFPEELLSVCSCIIVFCDPLYPALKQPDEVLFWIKPASTKNYSKHCGRFVEMIQVRRGDAFTQLHWSQMTGVYDDRLIMPPTHPHEKPVSLIERLLRIYTLPGHLVFDPFMGSCSTGLACMRTRRRFVGSEIDPMYYTIAEERVLKEQGTI